MLHFLGFILLALGAVMLAPILVAFLAKETYLLPYFIIPAVIALALGVFLRRRFQPTEITLGKAMVLVAFGWIIFAAFGSVPYILGNNMPVEDAYFESMSGFTTTGLTMISNVEEVALTILFWRSLTQWVGGIGVIVLFLTALIGFGEAARKMYVAEARTERVEPSIRETARSIGKIYVFLTLLGIIGLYFAGAPNMSLFEAVNHSMAGISTGGFTIRNTSFAGYSSPVLAVTILIIVAGATSFAIHRKVLGGNWRELFKSVEVRAMIVLIILSTLVLVWFIGLKDAVFQSTAAITTTGFSSTDIAVLGDLSKGMLTILMFIGGGYGASSGAIKLIRTVIIVSAVYWMIKRSFLPERAVVPMKISGRIYTEREIMETAIFAFIYVIVLICGAIVLMSLGNSAMDSVFESTSAQGNVGLSVGITSAAMPLAGKISMTVQMLVGRLEIIPVIAFVSYLIAKVPRPRRKPF